MFLESVFPKDPSEPKWLGSGKGEEEESLLSFGSSIGEVMKFQEASNKGLSDDCFGEMNEVEGMELLVCP